jgi:nucleoside-diphosphate-sugar epimerase
VLVTGGLGFIGSHLAAALVERGAEVTIVDALIPGLGANPYNLRDIEDSVAVVRADLRDPAGVDELVSGRDHVFNLAGQGDHLASMRDPENDLALNCRAQLNLLEACRRSAPETRLVFAASRQQYGRPRTLPVHEDHPLDPVDVNGINLCSAEAYHLLYHRVYGLRSSSLRLTNTYGPHMRLEEGGHGFISHFIGLALHGETIDVYGDGSQVRDFLYVSDAVDAFLAVGITEATAGQAVNVGGCGRTSVREFAELCQSAAGRSGRVVAVPWPEDRAAIDVGSVYLDHSRLEAATGWRPQVGIADGIRQTLDFYRSHAHAYRS